MAPVITLPDYQQERIGSQIAEGEVIKSARPHALSDAIFNYCPGCTHGIVNRLVAEVIDELGIEGKTIGIAPPTRATATSPPSALPRPSTPPPAARRSPSSSSTTPSTA